MADYKIIFALPAYGSVSPEFAVNFAATYQKTVDAGFPSGIIMVNTVGVDRARNDLVYGAIGAEATHIMWIDADIMTPSDVVPKLLVHNVPVASGLYHHKSPPYNPVAYQLEPEFAIIDSAAILNGPCLVDGSGLGCILMTTQVLKDMAEYFGDEAWFQMSLSEGEDCYFFQRLNQMGHRTILDPSVRCGHIGNYIYTTNDWKPRHDS